MPVLTFNVLCHIIQDHLMIEPKVRSFEYDLRNVYLIFSGKHVVKMRHLCLCIHLIVQIVFVIQTIHTIEDSVLNISSALYTLYSLENMND